MPALPQSVAGFLRQAGLTLCLVLVSARALRAQDPAPVSAIGGTTLSAGLADSRTQLNQAMGADSSFGADSLAQFADAYRASGGGPTLAFLGFNPFQIVATGAFHQLYWSAIVTALGIAGG